MIDSEKVLTQLALLAGLEETEARRWLPLCQGAADWVAGRLRRGVDAAAHEQALILAAAGLANYQRVLAGGTQPALRVADVEVGAEKSGGITGAMALRDQLLAQVAHLLIPEGSPALLGVDAL